MDISHYNDDSRLQQPYVLDRDEERIRGEPHHARHTERIGQIIK